MGKMTVPENLTIYVFPNGIGDGMMATAVARNFYACYGRPMHVGHKNAELFVGNPTVVCHPEYAYKNITGELRKQALREGVKLVCVYYFDFLRNGTGHWNFVMHEGTYVGKLCSRAGMSGYLNVTPQLFLTEDEKKFGKYFNGDKQIAIISGGIERYKHWTLENLKAVVTAFPQMHFVQLGVENDEALPGTLDLRGKLTLRQIAGVLSNSRLFLGETGGLMHIARAVRCHSVILSPDFEHGNHYYRAFKYVQSEFPCLECQKCQKNFTECTHPETCTGNITVEQVINKLKAELLENREVMADEFENVDADAAHGMELFDRMQAACRAPFMRRLKWTIRRALPEWLVKAVYGMIDRPYVKIK